jgi:NAD(P)H-quinone oxidoreductase subunit 5
MTPPLLSSSLGWAFALVVPISLVVGALTLPPRDPLRTASRWSLFALGASLVAVVAAALSGFTHVPGGLPLRVDAVTAVLLPLVAALGAVIVRFSRSYLRGDPGGLRYARSLLGTLGAATSVLLARDLAFLAAAWTLLSLSLQPLLTHFDARPAARAAAHKKFLLSRAADVTLWSAIGLVYAHVGSTDLDALARHVGATADLSGGLRAAAALLALSAVMKCAQLPFHGWLTQVMEAPTPVSALLHAGVVNVGGVLLLRVAPLVDRSPEARCLLLAFGLGTAIVASLVGMTRVSVKVALAWSTCAQMGFMLAECGAGLWHLALLHLVAHSLYKAHAFLRSGSAVASWRAGTLLAPPRALAGRASSLAHAVVCVALVAAVARAAGLLHAAGDAGLTPLLLLLVVALASAPAERLAAATAPRVAMVALYLGWHLAAARALGPGYAAPDARGAWALFAGVAALAATAGELARDPAGGLARALHPALFAGLHLDEHVTRLTARLWPLRLPEVAPLITLGPAPEVRS